MWPCERRAQRFDARAIDPEVAPAKPRRRAYMDDLRGGVDLQLQVIDETDHPRLKLGVHVIRLPRHDARAGLHRDGTGQPTQCHSRVAGVGKRATACSSSVARLDTQFGFRAGASMPSRTPSVAGGEPRTDHRTARPRRSPERTLQRQTASMIERCWSICRSAALRVPVWLA